MLYWFIHIVYCFNCCVSSQLAVFYNKLEIFDYVVYFLDIEETPVQTYFSDEEIWHVLTNLCGKTTSAEFQQLSRPQQKHYLWEAHEKGIGPRALFRLTGVPYSIVQRATSAENEKILQSGMVCESTPEDEEGYSYCSPDEFEPYPEY